MSGYRATLAVHGDLMVGFNSQLIVTTPQVERYPRN